MCADKAYGSARTALTCVAGGYDKPAVRYEATVLIAAIGERL
ncbi:hypothetical protein [Streptomyces sp. NRRL S-378]